MLTLSVYGKVQAALFSLAALVTAATEPPSPGQDVELDGVIDDGWAVEEGDERASFEVTFSALPHSFRGVSDCGDQNRLTSEAQKACMMKARALYGELASATLVTGPDWHAWHDNDDVCKKYIGGLCVDYARECSASFDRLNCTMRINTP